MCPVRNNANISARRAVTRAQVILKGYVYNGKIQTNTGSAFNYTVRFPPPTNKRGREEKTLGKVQPLFPLLQGTSHSGEKLI